MPSQPANSKVRVPYRAVVKVACPAQDRFGGDPAIIGKPVRVDDEPHTVVGVLGEGPADHQQNNVWLPLAFTEEQIRSGTGGLNVMARLKDDVALPQANASMRALQGAVESCC